MKRQNIFQSFHHAFTGILRTVRSERNMKIHMVAALAALFLAWRLGLDVPEKLLVILTVAGVLCLELVNTAIESIVDLISPEIHPLAKAAKDAAAGAVLVMAMAAAVIGYILFFDKLFG
jgi:undecaprenol kinase/diacylglycerol kinase (ATP)